MRRTKLDSLLVGKALGKVQNPMECHTTLESVVARKAKKKCTKDSDFNPSVAETFVNGQTRQRKGKVKGKGNRKHPGKKEPQPGPSWISE